MDLHDHSALYERPAPASGDQRGGGQAGTDPYVIVRGLICLCLDLLLFAITAGCCHIPNLVVH